VGIEDEQVQLLIDLGFTKNQAKIYLMLLKLEATDASTLSKKINVPRSEVYRTLGELISKGLVEKEIAVPYQFKATPINFGLQILVAQRFKKCKEIEEKTKKFLREFQSNKKKTLSQQKYKLTKIEGRERLIQVIKLQHDKVQRNVDIMTTMQRWLQILHYVFEDYIRAFARGVKYRVVLEASPSEISSRENIQSLLKKQNFDLRLSRSPLKTNAAIFDQNEVTINFFPSQSIAESPIIWTNHPSFISMCQDHFNTVWKTAREYKLAN
jgi:sugar-specific transcriptional regulator TrmB